jgi:hypothetical protein
MRDSSGDERESRGLPRLPSVSVFSAFSAFSVLLTISFLPIRQDSVYAAFANSAIGVCRALKIAVLISRPWRVT